LTYEWDGFNRLARAKEGAATVATYLYDAEGRRVGKDAGSAAARYALDGWREIEEYAGATVWPRRQFVFGAFIDEPLAMDVNDNYNDNCAGAGDHRYYYLQNWIYSVVALTGASGRVVEGYQYDPYGHHLTFTDDGQSTDFTWLQTIADRGASTYGNPFLFTGRRFDAETGLFYYRNRYYDVLTGRFLTRDPLFNNYAMPGYDEASSSHIGVTQSVEYSNLYRYANISPISNSDPYGLVVWYPNVDTGRDVRPWPNPNSPIGDVLVGRPTKEI
jgi:RHS repeat-associated protein